MARLNLTSKQTLGNYPTLPVSANAADFSFTAAGADYADGFAIESTGRELLLVHNGNVGAQTVTISSTPDDLGRTGDITTYSVGADEYAVFQLMRREGWVQSGTTKIYGAASAADVELAVIKIKD